MHKRTPKKRAAGVSPPWVWKRLCTDTSAIVRKTADGVCACVWMTVASALIGTTGADAPRSCVAVRMSAGGKTILAMHKRTPKKERRASARRGCTNRVCNGNARDFRKQVRMPRTHHGGLTPPALVCRVPQTAGRRRWTSSAARFVSHGGLTPPALVHRVPQTGCRRRWASIRGSFRFPRGLTPPALALPCECLPAKNDFCDAQTHTEKKSGGREPAVGVETLLHRHERDCSQDRRRCVCVCVDDRCIRVNRYHGGLTPPALLLRCECLPAKNDFSDAQTHTEKERRALVRRGRGNTFAQTRTRLSARLSMVCVDRRCIRAQRHREEPTLVPAPAFRDLQSLCSRARFPRGAYAPRSFIAVRMSAGEKRFFRCTNAHSPGAAGVSPPWLGEPNAVP
jgi:hypothetical protein